MIGEVADGRAVFPSKRNSTCNPWRARELGLPDDGCGASRNTIARRQVLASIVWLRARPRRAVEPGDLLLAIDAKVVNRFPRG